MQMLNFTNSCYLKVENNIYMTKNAIAWIREDFRIEHNPALSYATQNHENVIALFIYNKADFDNKREAQKWWISKSLKEFSKDLQKFKANTTQMPYVLKSQKGYSLRPKSPRKMDKIWKPKWHRT